MRAPDRIAPDWTPDETDGWAAEPTDAGGVLVACDLTVLPKRKPPRRRQFPVGFCSQREVPTISLRSI